MKTIDRPMSTNQLARLLALFAVAAALVLGAVSALPADADTTTGGITLTPSGCATLINNGRIVPTATLTVDAGTYTSGAVIDRRTGNVVYAGDLSPGVSVEAVYAPWQSGRQVGVYLGDTGFDDATAVLADCPGVW